MPWRIEPEGTEIDVYHYHMTFNDSLYVADYPLASQRSVVVFVVYRLQAYKGASDMENFLFASGEGLAQRSVCFSPEKFARGKKRCIRVYGVDVPESFLEFSDWGTLADPTATGKWNVLAIWWRPPGTKSSLWVNYGRDHQGGKMLEFNASNRSSGSTTAI